MSCWAAGALVISMIRSTVYGFGILHWHWQRRFGDSTLGQSLTFNSNFGIIIHLQRRISTRLHYMLTEQSLIYACSWH